MKVDREKFLSGCKYAQAEPDSEGNAIARGTLRHGLKIGKVLCKRFTMREPKAGDLFHAEQQVPPDRSLAFNAALWTRTLSLEEAPDVPLTLGMFGALKQGDYSTLRAAQMELDLLGEAD